jgi:hypothetical protein
MMIEAIRHLALENASLKSEMEEIRLQTAQLLVVK